MGGGYHSEEGLLAYYLLGHTLYDPGCIAPATSLVSQHYPLSMAYSVWLLSCMHVVVMLSEFNTNRSMSALAHVSAVAHVAALAHVYAMLYDLQRSNQTLCTYKVMIHAAYCCMVFAACESPNMLRYSVICQGMCHLHCC